MICAPVKHKVDDALDVFGCYGIGGMRGIFCPGLSVCSAVNVVGGLEIHCWLQLTTHKGRLSYGK
jgi:ammonia channel protein AmtB